MTLDFVQQIVKFVGGKFRDSSVDHENNENWHPTKITRYTVVAGITGGLSAITGKLQVTEVCRLVVRSNRQIEVNCSLCS